jgi:hypothetical protein
MPGGQRVCRCLVGPVGERARLHARLAKLAEVERAPRAHRARGHLAALQPLCALVLAPRAIVFVSAQLAKLGLCRRVEASGGGSVAHRCGGKGARGAAPRADAGARLEAGRLPACTRQRRQPPPTPRAARPPRRRQPPPPRARLRLLGARRSVAEVAVGLAIIVALYRSRQTIYSDELTTLKG